MEYTSSPAFIPPSSAATTKPCEACMAVIKLSARRAKRTPAGGPFTTNICCSAFTVATPEQMAGEKLGLYVPTEVKIDALNGRIEDLRRRGVIKSDELRRCMESYGAEITRACEEERCIDVNWLVFCPLLRPRRSRKILLAQKDHVKRHLCHQVPDHFTTEHI